MWAPSSEFEVLWIKTPQQMAKRITKQMVDKISETGNSKETTHDFMGERKEQRYSWKKQINGAKLYCSTQYCKELHCQKRQGKAYTYK